MPFLNGVYTPPDGAEDAVPGEVIRSATWNTIFTDLSNALTQVGQAQVPSAQRLQATIGQALILFMSRNVNFNAATTDTGIPVVLPTGFSLFLVNNMRIINTGPTPTLSTTTCGVFTSPGGAGATIVASGTTVTIVSNQANVVNNAQALTVVNGGTEYYNTGTVYFRVQTPQGTVASANVALIVQPIS